MVDEHGGTRLGRRGSVGDERGQQPALQHAEAARDRDRGGQVAEQVGEHQGGDVDVAADGAEQAAEHRDVEAEVAERADQSPARVPRCTPAVVDAPQDQTDSVLWTQASRQPRRAR
ncbi:MAG TPA: hypothetical protein VG223_15120, partial [Solirubrobacteraceae bacterium]|nr:hypothetical protein [Solirubrobacteraceae bacterium]